MLGGTGNIDLGGGTGLGLQIPGGSTNSLKQIGPLSLQVPPGGGGDVRDGDYFTITRGTTNYVFEFEDTATVPGGNGARRLGSILINFNPADTQSQLANRIVARLNSVPGLILNAVSVPGGVINMTPVEHTSVVTLPLIPNHLFQTGPLSLPGADGRRCRRPGRRRIHDQ